MKKFDYHRPQSLKEALSLMEKAEGEARYVAGGTDLIVRIKQKSIQPDSLISLRGIESLKGIRKNGGLSLGSMTLFGSMERDKDIADRYTALSEAVKWLANPQIRNVATIGGNICNSAPSADSVPPLLVMEAIVTIEGPGGERRVPIDEFFTGPGENCMDPTEILTGIDIPGLPANSGTSFLKLGRVMQDLAVVNAAAMMLMEKKKCKKCRLAVGAVAPVPLRLKSVEKIVEGEEITPELLEKAAQKASKEVSPITDVRSTEEYRRTVSGVLVKRAILRAIDNTR